VCTKFVTAIVVAGVIARDKVFGDLLTAVDSILGRTLHFPTDKVSRR